jgi:hypothetical protein
MLTSFFETTKEVPMRIIFAFCLLISACGSKELAEALKEANASESSASEQTTSAPAVFWSPTPSPLHRDMVTDYKKIAEGMKREEIVTILGEPHKREKKTFCDSGECKEYEYLSYLYKEGKIGVTILGGIATFTYAM